MSFVIAVTPVVVKQDYFAVAAAFAPMVIFQSYDHYNFYGYCNYECCDS